MTLGNAELEATGRHPGAAEERWAWSTAGGQVGGYCRGRGRGGSRQLQQRAGMEKRDEARAR